ncbi:hypothetical protein [Frigoribacterium sp. PhB24]|uniref:hypothetical protein n=1 Tax=Frigoribacterium sp. PhB24 TaxID=2485204 RepID=UPI000F473539|nr:hypothetical protein [Frigoribacterium sp. PhB24]ROS54742.1 hypothetical protein EDF50_0834 [Frigoribacterium sp. PhB24]
MITKFSWRRAVAVPAVLTLALGGALLSSTAAQAAPGNLVITSPTDGGATTSRTVVVTGSVTPGAIVTFSTAEGGTELTRTTSDRNTGAFTATLPTYADDAVRNQSVFVNGLVGFSGFDEPKTLSFVLPLTKYLTLATPTEGSTTDSRTVTFTGTATQGSTVTVSNASGELGRQNLGNASTYSITVPYDAAATQAQTVTVGGILGGSGLTPITRNFTIPAVAAPAKTVTLDSPAAGTTTESRSVTFTGTAPVGSTVTITGADGELGRANLGNASTYSITVEYAADAPVDQTVTVGGFVGGSGFDNTVVRSFALPAEVVPPTTPVVLDAPVITSPTQGQVVVGDQVTFEGTGTPGSNILLAVVPTDQLPELEAPADEMRAAAEPADPADPIVVDADGNWTVTLALTPDDYTAAAVAFLLDADGAPVLDDAGQPIVSDPSADVAFSLVAAVVPAGTPATPIATGTAGTTGLAYTGSEGTEAAIGIGAAVLLLGSTLMVLARRRAKLATTDVAGE